MVDDPRSLLVRFERTYARAEDRPIAPLAVEYRVGPFLEFDCSDVVVDIREQFPLDRDETREIAFEMGVAHPRDVKTNVDIVMTSDFLLDIRFKGEVRLLAWSIKPEEQLGSARTVEKLEIERRYLHLRLVGWKLSTEAELPQVRAQNLRFLNAARTLDDLVVPYPGYWRDRCEQFRSIARKHPRATIADARRMLAEFPDFGDEDLLTVIRHLAANKELTAYLDVAIDFDGSLAQFRLAEA